MKKIYLRIALAIWVLLIVVTGSLQGQDWSCVSPAVEINSCPSTYVPHMILGGGVETPSQVIINANATGPITGKFRFTLFDVSDEPGYCMNIPAVNTIPANAMHSDTWKDLRFGSQAGFVISGPNDNIAETTATNLSSAQVRIDCFDFGAFGKLKVELISNSGTVILGIEQGNFPQTWVNIPVDANSNFIADYSVDHNVGPNGTFGAQDDNDIYPLGATTPAGVNIDGDNISRYQEYRGFVINGTHQRLDVNEKDVFVHNKITSRPNIAAYFNANNLTAPIHFVQANEFNGPTRFININVDNNGVDPKHFEDQSVIVIENDMLNSSNGHDDKWGVSKFVVSGQIPNGLQYSIVDIGKINSGWSLTAAVNPTQNSITVNYPANPLFIPYNNGSIKINNEIIPYTGRTASASAGTIVFHNCVRLGTMTHPLTSLVQYFSDVDDIEKTVFAHELGHCVGLQHTTPVDQTIMNEYLLPGAVNGTHYWNNFNTLIDILGHFRLKE